MTSPTQPQTFVFQPGNLIPNHPRWPLLLYRGVLQDKEASRVDAKKAEALLSENGWVGLWRNGIYPYHHYHTTSHEVLVVTYGEAHVTFGGPQGETVALHTGDVAVLPAGTGHCCLSARRDFEVVGAYPTGQEAWDLERNAPSEAALRRIAELPRPSADPVYGVEGPLLRLWS